MIHPIKLKLLLCLFVLVPVCGAEEAPRRWTNPDGKTLTATLKGKTSTTCDLLLQSGNKITLGISSLSEADRNYVAQADVAPDPVMRVQLQSEKAPMYELKHIKEKGGKTRTEKVKTRDEERSIAVSVSGTDNRHHVIHVIWLEHGPHVCYQEKKEVRQDGIYTFTHSFSSPCAGYAVGLRETNGKNANRWNARFGTDSSLVRFLGNVPPKE